VEGPDGFGQILIAKQWHGVSSMYIICSPVLQQRGYLILDVFFNISFMVSSLFWQHVV